MQFVKRFQNFKLGNLPSQKYFYICNSAGYPEEGDWIVARNQIADIFKSGSFQQKIVFKNQDFSASETHWSVFQIGVLNGIKDCYDYQYFNVNNLLKYYDDLYKQKLTILNPQNLNQLAYTFFYMGKTKRCFKNIALGAPAFSKRF
jgi:hypothetical protein